MEAPTNSEAETNSLEERLQSQHIAFLNYAFGINTAQEEALDTENQESSPPDESQPAA